MSLIFERSSVDSIQNGSFNHHRLPPPLIGAGYSGDRKFIVAEPRKEDFESDSTSSIGNNSDDEEELEEQVQSFLNKGPLDTMDALEEVLPIRKGISKFYNGKSKSFTSLADATSVTSVEELAKPENPFNRKQKNLLARNAMRHDKNQNSLNKDDGSCISERPANRSTLAHGSAINCLPKNNNNKESSCLPPLHPRAKTRSSNGSCSPPLQWNSNLRSFSLSDLQSADAAAISNH